jgi:uncharacterized protein
MASSKKSKSIQPKNPIAAARKRLKIPETNRAILCLDGGGIRGIMTIQLLKRLEEVAQIPCHQLFDMVAGTSTGGIIAGLIAAGRTAVQIEQLYTKFVLLVFTKRSIFANRFLDPPQYSKKNYRAALKDELGDLKLWEVCEKNGIDLLITSKDVAEGEETYFSCKRGNDGKFADTYKDVLLRGVMEATMSAPTFFTPLERFVDGGVTTYNNPTLAAITEAVRYGPRGKYKIDQLTVMSFGTGYRPQFISAAQVPNPPGMDVRFWLQWVMSEAGADASDMQGYFLRAGLCAGLDYRRFQISLDKTAIGKLPPQSLDDDPHTPQHWLADLSDEDLAGIELDDVKHFNVMRAIGKGMVAFIDDDAKKHGEPFPFTHDLLDANGKELLVTREGDIKAIRKQLSDPNWLDNFAP